MIVEVGTGGASIEGVDVVGVPVRAGDDGPRLAVDGGRMASTVGVTGEPDPAWCHRHGFTGKSGQVAWWPGPASAEGAAEPDRAFELVLVGMGKADEASGDRGLESVRRAVAAFVRAAKEVDAGAFLLPDARSSGAARAVDGVGASVAAAAAEGGMLAAYHYDAYRTAEPSSQLGRLVLVPGDDDTEAEEGARRGVRIAESVALARDLVNEPPSSLTPERFAAIFTERFAGLDEVSIEVWDEERITAERLGGLLGVSRGSNQPPRLVRAEYRPPGSESTSDGIPHLVLVGKGITFDSGGLSLKTATGMETMKTDMGGAAAVLCALDAAAALGAPLRITAIAPLTENMPGGSATKPGDVLTTRSGKTIEVLNTDAEGRLVLADGLTLAAEAEPDAIIDLATLTGAAVVALGKDIASLFGSDEGLLDDVRRAGERTGEPSWPMPLPDDYRSHIDSEVADMRNIGRPGQAGSIAAALLLREFVGSVPWVHMDIAGPARSDDATRYLSKGGTGFGVRTLVALATSEDVARRLSASPEV
jgi:leucyl aminopeptidase